MSLSCISHSLESASNLRLSNATLGQQAYPPSAPLWELTLPTPFARVTSPARTHASESDSAEGSVFTDEDGRMMSQPLTIKAPSPRKRAVCGFLPLPPITASPVCTPTSTAFSEDVQPVVEESPITSVSPSSQCAVVGEILSPPTWIATPPTPPKKSIRRSFAYLSRSRSLISPSTSLPASTSPHVDVDAISAAEQRASAPAMRRRASLGSSGIVGRFLSAWNDETSASALARNAMLIRPTSGPFQGTITGVDISRRLTESPEAAIPKGAWSDTDTDTNIWQSKKAKDDVRKHHALLELWTTEVGYLQDLRALVIVYLRIIPTLVCRPSPSGSAFGRTPSSFTSNVWVTSSALCPSEPTDAAHSPAKEFKSAPKYLFSDAEVELLTRNAEDILQLHENFVNDLRNQLNSFGYPVEHFHSSDDSEKLRQSQRLQNVDAIIRAVSTKFATEASRFNSYETFCAGHPQALDVVRKVSTRYSAEWDAFEQRCSALISKKEFLTTTIDGSRHPYLQPDNESTTATVRKRSSAPSLHDFYRASAGQANLFLSKEHSPLSPDKSKERSSPRLTFTDYLIKPVQRICKYPLLLDQLKSSKSLKTSLRYPTSDVDVVVESAAQAMRHVASAVDEARRLQDAAIQSALIASRIMVPSSSSAIQSLTPSFLASLGNCLLAGSLDVVHSYGVKGATCSNKEAKYLGAFLYLGGYLILVKVLKNKIYEPRHWFSLAEFDLSEPDEEDGVLPCSFRLSSYEHRFDLAAACQKEKDSWLQSIRDALTHTPTWTNEPTPSLWLDGKGELIPSCLDDGPFEVINALPTIQSIPEISDAETSPASTEILIESDPKQQKKAKTEAPFKADLSNPPSRRSSTASVIAIFTPSSSESDTVVIRRSSLVGRSRVDQGLQDVFSQSCITARTYAYSRDEELFQTPNSRRGGFSRSQSGLSIAKSRLVRHESVRVLRRKSLLDADSTPHRRRSLSGKTLASRRRGKNLTITSVRPENDDATNSSGLPSPFSPTSSISTPTRCSASDAPSLTSSLSHSLNANEAHEPKSPRTSRSLVDNVRSLFQPRCSPNPHVPPHQDDTAKASSTIHSSSSLIKRLVHGSIHRRTRSVPDVEDILPSKAANEFGLQVQQLPTGTRSSESILQPRPSLRFARPSRRKSFLSPNRTADGESATSLSDHSALFQRFRV